MVQLVSSGKILKCIFLSLKSTVISKIDPSSREVETEAPLGPTDQSAYAVWKVSGQWKTPSQRRLVAFLKTTLRLSFSLHTETYTHVHTPTHTPPFFTNQKKEDRTKEDIKRRDYVRSHLPKQQPFYVVYTPFRLQYVYPCHYPDSWGKGWAQHVQTVSAAERLPVSDLRQEHCFLLCFQRLSCSQNKIRSSQLSFSVQVEGMRICSPLPRPSWKWTLQTYSFSGNSAIPSWLNSMACARRNTPST